MFPHNCTVYREGNGQWVRTVVRGVLWHDVEGIHLSKSGMKESNSLELFVPFAAGYVPKKKDMVVKGILEYEIERKPSELFPLGEVRTLNTVDVYDFGSLRQYKAGGR